MSARGLTSQTSTVDELHACGPVRFRTRAVLGEQHLPSRSSDWHVPRSCSPAVIMPTHHQNMRLCFTHR